MALLTSQQQPGFAAAAGTYSVDFPDNCLTMTEANVKVAQHYDALPNWNQNYDTAAMLTLLTKGFGCSSCQPKRNAPSGSHLTYYSYITSPGYDGIPPYEAFLN